MKPPCPLVVSIVDRQLWTLTLKRNGPFGDEQVPGTYARLPLMTIALEQVGEAPRSHCRRRASSGSRPRVLPSDLKAAPTSAIGFSADRRRSRRLSTRVDDRHAPFTAIVRPFALGQRTRIVGRLQREELRDVDLVAVRGDRRCRAASAPTPRWS